VLCDLYISKFGLTTCLLVDIFPITFWNKLCSCNHWGEGRTRGASDIVKAECSGEDPRATAGLVSNLPHPRVNKTKEHTEYWSSNYLHYQ